MEKFAFGSCKERKFDVVPLFWRAHRLDTVSDHREIVASLPREKSGVYVFEGRHDGSAGRSLLYIGRSGKKSSPPDEFDPGGSLKTRVPTSMKRISWQKRAEFYLYSDVWDVVVRVAECGGSVVERVESALIVAHAPALNAQGVRKDLAEEDGNLLVLNAGAKGLLLPAVAGAYYSGDHWPDEYPPKWWPPKSAGAEQR